MNHNEMIELIKLFEKSSLEIMELGQGENRLYLKKMTGNVAPVTQAIPVVQQAAAPVESSVEADTNYHSVTSPMVGTFYRASSPEAEPFVKVGDSVKKGDVLCIIEAMKMLNEIQADVDGVIAEIKAENGTIVDYGKTLFLIEEKNV